MKILILRKFSFTKKRIAEIETALRFLNENTPETWEIEYLRDKDLEDYLEIEGGDNLDEHAIQSYVNRDDVDYIHVDMTDSTWRKLDLRPTLYGQAQLIDGQGITYGRWTERNADRVKYLPEHLQYLSEVGLGIVHEIGHCLSYTYKIGYTSHYYFYGYDKRYTAAQERDQDPKRWQRTPDPDVYYKNLPWHNKEPMKGTILPKEYEDKISQAYLTPADFYSVGYHIGTDWACPLFTPVYAPFDGRTTRREVLHKTLGNCGYYLYKNAEGEYEAMRFMHLAMAPVVGNYKKGDIIGYTGNTGFSTGPHLHIDVWRGGYIKIDQIRNKETILAYTKDPIEAFGLGDVTPPEKTLADYTSKELLNEVIKRV
mgnify:CR=1 FL=1